MRVKQQQWFVLHYVVVCGSTRDHVVCRSSSSAHRRRRLKDGLSRNMDFCIKPTESWRGTAWERMCVCVWESAREMRASEREGEELRVCASVIWSSAEAHHDIVFSQGKREPLERCLRVAGLATPLKGTCDNGTNRPIMGRESFADERKKVFRRWPIWTPLRET